MTEVNYMANCPNCGQFNNEGQKFCTACGTPLEVQAPAQPVNNAPYEAAAQQPVNNAYTAPNQAPQGQTYSQPVYAAPVAPVVDESKKPLSVGGFVGTMLLSCIPLVGLICMIVFACGAVKNVNRQNYARAWLIMMAISIALGIVLSIVLVAVGASLMSEISPGFFYDMY